jgi:hypothetical protein
MPDTPGSLRRRAAIAACLALGFTSPLFAQSPAAAPAPGPDFFTRYSFHLSANALAIEDERFSWDTHFRADLDVVDYVKGRTSILVEYEAVLGDEFRAFDPNQAYYTLEASSSYRIGAAEVAGVFHHVSRHLSDRDKRDPIAWNVLGARLLGNAVRHGITLEARVEAGSVVQHSFVDYAWTGDVDLLISRKLRPRVGVFGHGHGVMVGVDGTIANRGRQKGGLVEGGVRFEGRAGALELFAGLERRIDADPLDLLPRQWGVAGFRLLSK